MNPIIPNNSDPATIESNPWPRPLRDEAFQGIAGEVVGAIEPHTEADPAALLITFLEFAGNVIGRGPHAVVESARHGTNLNAVLVGESSKSRKGSSESRVRELFVRADPEWSGSRIMSGLSSGEGLVWHVRDSTEDETDQGVEDKRLLVIESEFASVLKVMERQTNTLSTFIRQAWDSGDLRLMTKNSPAVATGAHVSILGHISKNELKRHLTETEMGNGFANRFLWMCVRRARILPEGGGEPAYEKLVPRLQDALDGAQGLNVIARDEKARRVWAEIYPELSAGKSGLSGAVIARAEAQVLRLSVLYAALDGSDVIRLPHQNAALAVWDYSEESALHIFGDSLGDPIADRILAALRTEDMTRTDIFMMFKKNIRSALITQALNLLLRENKVRYETRKTDGRSAIVWMAI